MIPGSALTATFFDLRWSPFLGYHSDAIYFNDLVEVEVAGCDVVLKQPGPGYVSHRQQRQQRRNNQQDYFRSLRNFAGCKDVQSANETQDPYAFMDDWTYADGTLQEGQIDYHRSFLTKEVRTKTRSLESRGR